MQELESSMHKSDLPPKSKEKAEHATLIVALIAAAASLLGVLYNQHSVSALEEKKWQQAQ